VWKYRANADDRRERLVLLAFRWWLRIRPTLKATSSLKMANTCSVGGFILAIIAIPIAVYTWLGLIVAGVGVYAGFGYSLDGYIKRKSMRAATAPDSNIKAQDFLNVPRSPDDGYRLARPANGTKGQLYPYVDLSDHSLFIRAENGLTREECSSLYERWYGLCPDAFMHLEKLVDGHWRPISVSIMLPLSVAGYRAIITRDRAHRLRVVDLDHEDVLPRLASKNPFLLIDTWIVDREGGFGGVGHGKSESRGGNANLLVLRHLALFWTTKLRHLNLLVETDNRYLVRVLWRLSFTQSGTSKIGEAFYHTNLAQFDALAPKEFVQVKNVLKEIESAPVAVGTAPIPPGWHYE
jgi:hypothetical protein